jgi:hypothetical protein
MLHSVLETWYDIYGVSKVEMELTNTVCIVLGH